MSHNDPRWGRWAPTEELAGGEGLTVCDGAYVALGYAVGWAANVTVTVAVSSSVSASLAFIQLVIKFDRNKYSFSYYYILVITILCINFTTIMNYNH